MSEDGEGIVTEPLQNLRGFALSIGKDIAAQITSP
jgi:hypothetical protein